jgi:hypothetical protein
LSRTFFGKTAFCLFAAAYFHLYGVERADAETMLSTFTNTGLAPDGERGSRQALW